MLGGSRLGHQSTSELCRRSRGWHPPNTQSRRLQRKGLSGQTVLRFGLSKFCVYLCLRRPPPVARYLYVASWSFGWPRLNVSRKFHGRRRLWGDRASPECRGAVTGPSTDTGPVGRTHQRSLELPKAGRRQRSAAGQQEAPVLIGGQAAMGTDPGETSL